MSQTTRAPRPVQPPPDPGRRPPMDRAEAWSMAAALLGVTVIVSTLVRSLS